MLQSKILKTTGPANALYGVGLFNYNNANLFLVMGGYWYNTAIDKQSAIVMKSDMNFVFSAYTCGVNIQTIQAWDPLYYNTVTPTPVVTTSATIVTLIAALTGVSQLVNGYYYMSTWPLMPAAFSATLQTISYESNNVNENTIGGEKIPNFYKYPETNEQCYMYEVMKQIQDVDSSNNPVNSFEFTQGTGTQVITPLPIPASVTNCQG